MFVCIGGDHLRLPDFYRQYWEFVTVNTVSSESDFRSKFNFRVDKKYGVFDLRATFRFAPQWSIIFRTDHPNLKSWFTPKWEDDFPHHPKIKKSYSLNQLGSPKQISQIRIQKIFFETNIFWVEIFGSNTIGDLLSGPDKETSHQMTETLSWMRPWSSRTLTRNRMWKYRIWNYMHSPS